MPANPQRTCVGCRKKASQWSLARLVFDQGRLRVDPRRRSSGRGAYVCARTNCVSAGLSRGAFSRTLRAPIRDQDSAELGQRIAESYQLHRSHLIEGARRGGARGR